MCTMEQEEVIQRYKDGIRSRTKLAALAGFSRSKVDRMLMDAGYDLTPSRVSADDRAAMAQAYQDGASIRAVAMRWGIADSTVSLALRSAGVMMRRQGRPTGRRQVNNLTTDEILAAHRDGGVRGLADALGSSISTAYRAYNRAVHGKDADNACLADAL